MRPLSYDLRTISSLTPSEREELWRVYSRHFHAPRADFTASMALGTHVARFLDPTTGVPRGLVAYQIHQSEVLGRSFHWIWAGALAIDRPLRGRYLLEVSGLEIYARFRLRHPLSPLYWIYMSTSYQSYRMMARTFEQHWPHPDGPTPPWEQAAIDAVARRLVPERYDPERGLVLPSGTKSVRPDSARTTTPDDHPQRRFYRQINPLAAQGGSVVLLCPLALGNAGAMVRHTLGRRAA
jgi:hypothetical protein